MYLDTQDIRLLKVAILVAVVLTCLAGCEQSVVAADVERAQAACVPHDGLKQVVADGYAVSAACNNGLSATFAARKQ